MDLKFDSYPEYRKVYWYCLQRFGPPRRGRWYTVTNLNKHTLRFEDDKLAVLAALLLT